MWKEKVKAMISRPETPQGRMFDIVLMWAIVISIAAVILESVSSFRAQAGGLLKTIEWAVTFFFTVEYVLRLVCGKDPVVYAKSFLGVIDLLAVLPSYIGMFVVGAHSLIVLRALRLLRMFRIFKLARFVRQAEHLLSALRASRHKIGVFIVGVLTLVLILGTVMYMVEGESGGFSSIPQSMYWAIVTITTVGYGDIAPVTVLGKMIASIMMLIGYAIIAVPTGIITAEAVREGRRTDGCFTCIRCGTSGHQDDALYCRKCGEKFSASAT